jgi:hypothetical protein
VRRPEAEKARTGALAQATAPDRARPQGGSRARVTAQLALALLVLAGTARAGADDTDDARATMRKALGHSLLGFDHATLVVSLLIKGNRADAGEERRIVVRTLRRGERIDRTLCFLGPADLKNTAFLAANDGGQYLWLPELGRVRQVSRSSRSESFLGTTFSFRDVEGFGLDDATYKKLSDESIDGNPCSVVEATLKPSPGEEYGRVVSWVRKSDYMPLRVELYDTAGQHVKNLFTRRVATQAKSGLSYAQAARMEDLRSGGSTLLEIVDADFEAHLDDAAFTVAELRRGVDCAK